MFGVLKKEKKDIVEPSTQPTPAETRRTAAQTRMQHLQQERLKMQTRLEETTAEMARVDQAILDQERVGDDQGLSPLRSRRVELAARVGDLTRIIPTIDAEMRPVAAEIHEAHRAIAAGQYNTIAAEQRERTKKIAEKVNEFVAQLLADLAEHATGATQQNRLLQAMGQRAMVPEPARLSSLYVNHVARRVLHSETEPAEAMNAHDWTVRMMMDTGELESPPSDGTVPPGTGWR